MSGLPTPYTIQGARIESARSDKGLSQTDLALALRKWLIANTAPDTPKEYRERLYRAASQSTVSRWERGQRLPKGDLLGALAAVLNIDPRYILALPEAGTESQRAHPETVEADEAARLIDDMSVKNRKIAIAILRALAGL